jgi:hypothetical protein
MRKPYVKNSGQAAVELAIFGSLILLAFSVLLMYGQRLDNQQQVKMEAFRRALQKSYERNGNVSYTLKKEGRTFNLFSGFGQGQSSTVGSTATVLWQKGMPGKPGNEESKGFAYNAINDMEIGSVDEEGLPRYPKRQINISGKEVTVWATPSTYSEEQRRTEAYSSTVKKEESPSGGIVNTRISELQDSVSITPRVRVDKSKSKANDLHYVPLPDYVYEGQSYDNEGSNQTVASLPSVDLEAYSTDDNRVSYREDTDSNVNTIRRERSWQTDY